MAKKLRKSSVGDCRGGAVVEADEAGEVGGIGAMRVGRAVGVSEIAEVCEREIRDLPCFEYRTTVVIEVYRLRCPDCGVKTEKVAQLRGKTVQELFA